MKNVRFKLLPLSTLVVLATLSGPTLAQNSFNTTIQDGHFNTNDTYQRGHRTDNSTFQQGWDNANRTRQYGRQNWNQTGQFGRFNYNETRQSGFERNATRQVSERYSGQRRAFPGSLLRTYHDVLAC